MLCVFINHKYRLVLNIEIREDIPIQKIYNPLLIEKKVGFYIQRDDLLHKDVSGNKWRKLEYCLKNYDRHLHEGIISFGGAFSNHLVATSAACKLLKIPFIAYIRGDKPKELNHSIKFLEDQGAILHWVSRSDFRDLRTNNWPNPNPKDYRNFLIIPEGGQSELAVESCMHISQFWDIEYDFACCSIGTGTTFSGLVNGLVSKKTKCLGFVMLKDKGYLSDEISKMTKHSNYDLNRDYHFNGFGKVNDDLIEFLNVFYQNTKIPLDPIYTGKLVYGLFDLIEKNYFPEGSRIIAIHTGGLQGIHGFNALRRKKGKSILNYS